MASGPYYNRKGAIIRKMRNEKTKREGVVRLDKDVMIFFARIPDNAMAIDKPLMVESKDGHEVERWLEKELAKAEKSGLLKWVPVVMVNITESDRYGSRQHKGTKAGFEVRLRRFHIALTLDKTEWVQLDWEQADEESATALPPEERVAASKNFKPGPKEAGGANRTDRYGDKVMRALPFVDGYTSYIEYTPELWAGLLGIVETVNTAEAHFRSLVATKKGIAELSDNGVKRLASGVTAKVASNGEDDG